MSFDGGTFTPIIWTVKLVLGDLALALILGFLPRFHAKRIAPPYTIRDRTETIIIVDIILSAEVCSQVIDESSIASFIQCRNLKQEKTVKSFTKDLPSILISLGFLYLVLLITYIAIFQDKLFIAIVSSLGTLLVQRYLDDSRNEKKQQEFARLAISLINWRKTVFFYLRKKVISSTLDSAEIKSLIITRYIDQIRQDEVYKSMLKDVGVLPLNILKYFYEYDSQLKNLLDSLTDHTSHDSGRSLDSLKVQENLSIQIICNAIDSGVTTMLLSKQILKDRGEFEADKQFLIYEYWRAKDAIEKGEILPSVILNSLTQVEMVFTEIGASNELNVRPSSNNQEE